MKTAAKMYSGIQIGEIAKCFGFFFSQKNLRIGEHLHITDILIAVIFNVLHY